LGSIPLRRTAEGQVLVRDVAAIERGSMPGQFDRYNMKRQVTLTANISGADLGTVEKQVQAALARAGSPPAGSAVELRGQIPPMQEMQSGLSMGLLFALIAVFLLLTASFQSLRLALVAVATLPAVVSGVAVMLYVSGETINIQSFIGSIMAVGVAMANAILLVTFAEARRQKSADVKAAAVAGASDRLRAILMTSFAMIAGMLPMALAWGESGQQNAPLGRAVVGGLIAATLSTLFILPLFFVWLQSSARRESASMDPDDPHSPHFTHPRPASIATEKA
jgi:multidrug efflux pump subunit AcrB